MLRVNRKRLGRTLSLQTPVPSPTATSEPATGIPTGTGILGIVVLMGLLFGLWLARR